MHNKEVIVSDKAPQTIGPYSQGIRINNLVFTAGQLGIDRSTGNLVMGGIEAETNQALTNIQYILESAGTSLLNVIKTTVFLRDMQDFAVMNEVYSTFFKSNPPARSTIQVAALPKSGSVEIEAIAILP